MILYVFQIYTPFRSVHGKTSIEYRKTILDTENFYIPCNLLLFRMLESPVYIAK